MREPQQLAKRAYVKPVMKEVSLRPAEAVLVGACKSTTISGPGQSNCNTPAPCFDVSPS
jgi:hypothetical protein